MRLVLVQRAEPLDLGELLRVLRAPDVVRPIGPKHLDVGDEERPDEPDPGRGIHGDGSRRTLRWSGPPIPGIRARRVREGDEATVTLSCLEHRGRRRLTDFDPALLGRSVRHAPERCVVERLERPELRGGHPGQGRRRGREADEHAEGGGRGRGLLRVARIRGRRHEVRRVAAVDRVHRVVDGALHHRHAEHGAVRGLPGAGRRRREDRRRRDRVPLDRRVRGGLCVCGRRGEARECEQRGGRESDRASRCPSHHMCDFHPFLLSICDERSSIATLGGRSGRLYGAGLANGGMLPSGPIPCWPLDAGRTMTDNCRASRHRRQPAGDRGDRHAGNARRVAPRDR